MFFVLISNRPAPIISRPIIGQCLIVASLAESEVRWQDI